MRDGTFKYPDFSGRCPLCGGKNCAVKTGFYSRKCLIIHGCAYYEVKIQRYKCQRIRTENTYHKTFSLLPHSAIPYCQHDQNLMLETVLHSTDNTIENAKKYILEKNDISLEHSQIKDFNTLMDQAFVKLTSINKLDNILKNSDYYNSQNPAQTVIGFINKYQSKFTPLSLPAAEQLSVDYFYHFQGDQSYFDRHFLFGTPSQKRLRSP